MFPQRKKRLLFYEIFLSLFGRKISSYRSPSIKREEWIESRAFVDTGASYSLFHADFATILGLELEHGELREMVVGDGKILKVYIHRIRVSIAGQEFIASIGFSKDLGIGFYIIGRKDIFDRFLVSFNEKEKWVEFRPLL